MEIKHKVKFYLKYMFFKMRKVEILKSEQRLLLLGSVKCFAIICRQGIH